MSPWSFTLQQLWMEEQIQDAQAYVAREQLARRVRTAHGAQPRDYISTRIIVTLTTIGGLALLFMWRM